MHFSQFPVCNDMYSLYIPERKPAGYQHQRSKL
jgi:hypothetical protein